MIRSCLSVAKTQGWKPDISPAGGVSQWHLKVAVTLRVTKCDLYMIQASINQRRIAIHHSESDGYFNLKQVPLGVSHRKDELNEIQARRADTMSNVSALQA